MVFGPIEYFKLISAEEVANQLGANGRNLTEQEELLWANLELCLQVINTAGLKPHLLMAAEKAAATAQLTAEQRYLRYPRGCFPSVSLRSVEAKEAIQ